MRDDARERRGPLNPIPPRLRALGKAEFHSVK
jgi:hypothetical protein